GSFPQRTAAASLKLVLLAREQRKGVSGAQPPRDVLPFLTQRRRRVGAQRDLAEHVQEVVPGLVQERREVVPLAQRDYAGRTGLGRQQDAAACALLEQPAERGVYA